MRAGYGGKTRDFFTTQTNPKQLIDFAGVKIFENATVDTNILIFSKAKNEKQTLCAVTDKLNKDNIKELSSYVQCSHSICNFSTSDSWVILSPIEQSIKRKIELVGTPLKEWDIQINYGIKTGFNDAFIISTEKRNEILANCLTDEERKRTDKLIHPLLRGRDIKKYSYDWANLWLINIHNGVKGIRPRIDINEYLTIKSYLGQYWDKLSKRADKGDTPYNLRNCAYVDDFCKPKIIFQEIVQESQFLLDENNGFFCNDTGRIIVGEHLYHLLGVLNSDLFFFAVKHFYGGGTLGENGVRMKHTFFENFPCMSYDVEIERMAENLTTSYNQTIYEKLNDYICEKYGLTDEEKAYIRNGLH